MASKLAKKLEGLKVTIKKNPSVPRGKVVCQLTEGDLEEVGSEVKPEDEVWDDFMGKTGKVVIGAAVTENAFKAAALAWSTEVHGYDVAGEKLKSKLGVSGSDDSYNMVKEDLIVAREALVELQGYITPGSSTDGPVSPEE